MSQAKGIAAAQGLPDYISKVSKRSGYRLTVLIQSGKKDSKSPVGRGLVE